MFRILSGISRHALACALTGLVCLTGALHAQQATSGLNGTIADPSGAIIPGATLTLTSTESGSIRSVTSNESGFYQFVQLPPGTYDLLAESEGFQSTSVDNLELLVDTTTTLDLDLQVGDVSTVVSVEADAILVSTSDATVGAAFNEQKVRQLPLLTRNVVGLMSLQTGVNQTGEVLGARKDQNNVVLDGVDVNDQENPQPFQSVLPVPLDSVQEFRVTTVGGNADTGRSSGGQVVLLTKSGTNQFHGSLYEFHRNTVTSANTFFNNSAGVDRENLIRNQFGASIGGPIVKNRLFFFANWESRRDARAASVQRVVPSQDLRNGILNVTGTDGNVYRLTPEEFRMADPLGIGVNQNMLDVLNQFPTGNDAASGTDGGLNFDGFRFNAPLQLDNKAYVVKTDFNITESGSHRVFWRGTLADNATDVQEALAQYPGMDAAKQLDNSRGFATSYTGVLSPSIVNTLSVGYTRLSLAQTGATGAQFGLFDIDELQNFNFRPRNRVIPTWNINNDVNWVKGKHSYKFGVNARFIRNRRVDFDQSFPEYTLSQGLLGGLGSDIQQGINGILFGLTGDDTVLVADDQLATISGAALNLTGAFTDINTTYQYDQDGNVLPIGTGAARKFKTNEFEFYFADSWRAMPSLTINYGVRYSTASPASEVGGLQGAPTVGLDRYYADRVGAMELGIPANALPTNRLIWDRVDSWYDRDNNNFAPRLSLAWNPQNPTGALRAIFGENGVFRIGAGVYYDRYGSRLIQQTDTQGTFGVQARVQDPNTYNFSTAQRFDGTFPTLPAPPPGGFPAEPPTNRAIGNSSFAVSPNLVAPYTIPMTATFAREVPGGMTLEVGYAGRFSRKVLAQIDPVSPLIFFRDPQSGQTLAEAFQANRVLFEEQGLTNAQVAADPSLVPIQPFFENMFPALAGMAIDGSASANFFFVNNLWGRESELDTLDQLDRQPNPFRGTSFAPGAGAFPNCIVRTGCFTFFGEQFSSLRFWENANFANFHGMTLSLRKRFTNDFTFDFNYTWAHSIDLGSAAEGNLESNTQQTDDVDEAAGNIVNSFRREQSRASSDFDIRHQFNGNYLWELPFGRGKSGFMKQALDGWQVSGIVRYSTALPTNIRNGSRWATNFFGSGRAVPTGTPVNERGDSVNGVPSFFPDPQAAAANFRFNRTGEAGPRNVARLDDLFQTDLAVSKRFFMPWESHSLQFRWETFNLFNSPNFTGRNIQNRFDRPAVLGQFRTVGAPRVMQFALRYEF